MLGFTPGVVDSLGRASAIRPDRAPSIVVMAVPPTARVIALATGP